MRLNYETCIVGEKCVLVPYRPEHVQKYHEWMLDPHLLEMTGSEPLSIEEEIDMQKSWRDDDQKCTFIVLRKDQCNFINAEVASGGGGDDDDKDGGAFDDPGFCQRNLHAMVGDVNLFFSEEEDEYDGDDHNNQHETQQQQGCATTSQDGISSCQAKVDKQLQAELDIMIAEKASRGNGLGMEASCLMMLYGARAKHIRRFFCKIKETNDSSLALFQTRLGYQQCAYAACFQEYELERKEKSSKDMIREIARMLGEEFKWKTFKCSDGKITPSCPARRAY